MILSTYSDLKTKLQNDLDIQDLDFINGDAELLGYINEALNDAEAIIHNLGLESNYFLVQDTMTLANGTSDYALPTSIYASKIKKMFYINGQTKYEIFRVRDLNETPYFQSGDDYRYLLLTAAAGTSANNMRVRFYPTPAESGAYIQIWYLRNVTVMTSSTTDATNVCEIPEAVNYVYAQVKVRVYEKMGNPNLDLALKVFAEQKQLMIETLQEQVPDEDTTVRPDMSFYEDTYLGKRTVY